MAKRKRQRGRRTHPLSPRNRVKTDGAPVTAYVYFPNPNVPPPDGIVPHKTAPAHSATEFRHMVDTRGFIENWWNPCWHHKIVSAGQAGLVLHTVRNWSGDKDVMSFDNAYITLGDSFLSCLPTIPNDVLDDLRVWSEEKLVEACDAETDLANFIRELVECIWSMLKNLTQAMKRGKTFISALLKELRKLWPERGHYYSNPVVEILDLWRVCSPAQRFLIWKFVIAPFLKDLKDIWGSYDKAAKKQQWLLEHNGVPTLVRYRRKCVWEPELGVERRLVPCPFEASALEGVLTGGPGQPLESVTTEIYLKLVSYDLTYCCSGWVIFTLPEGLFVSFEGRQGFMRIWAHKLGLDNLPAILWEATRFSWLIDWLLSYRARFFERLIHCGPPGAKLLESGHSWKLVYQFEVIQQDTHYRSGEVRIDRQNIGDVLGTVYIRAKGLPSSEAYYFRLPWSWEQMTILWAIFEQRVWRRLMKKR